MDTSRPKYVSIYKIDGIPILPPLMTPEKRRQMLIFKELAIQLENARKKQQNHRKQNDQSSCNLLRHGHSHIPQPSQTPRKQLTEASTSKRERMDKLRKTDTLVYDNRANSIILTLEGFEEETDFQSMVLERPKSHHDQQKLDQNDNKISPDVSKSSFGSPTKDESSPSPSQNPAKPQPYAAFIPIPSICVNPPTPSVQNNPICATTTPSKRLCNSPTLKADIESNLIRSNSFTLDGPSSALLEHIKNQKIKKSTATQDTVESKAKRVQKVEVKPKAKSPSSPSLNHFANNTVLFRSKRSPYEMKPSSKTKLGRKHKIIKPIITNSTSKKAHNQAELSSAIAMTPPQSTSNLDLLKDIEEQHRARFIELVRQQQIEQKRLQKEFEAQQKQLLEQLSARVAKVQIQAGAGSPPSSSSSTTIVGVATESISGQSSPSMSPEQESSSSARATPTPRRRLFLENIKEPTATTGGAVPMAKDASPSPQSTSRRHVREENQRKRIHIAATIINAHARGFLTRRLFRTDYVQRIVQTIKDTLVFVINLHLETCGDDSESSLKLKARLLKQLTSACRTLHVVFFETTIKDRMEIIARDRKFIQAKLMSIKRSQRIVR